MSSGPPRASVGASVEVAAAHRAAHDEVMIAPTVIRADRARARTGGLQRAPEIRERERCHVVLNAEFDRRIVKSLHRSADLREQRALPVRCRLPAVRVEAAERDKEDLTFDRERVAQFDQACDLFELVAERRVREGCGERRVGRGERKAGLNRLFGRITRSLDERCAEIEIAQLVEGGAARVSLRGVYRRRPGIVERQTRN